nr:YncE family protein [uncultured Carboxylicivirga sp.]
MKQLFKFLLLSVWIFALTSCDDDDTTQLGDLTDIAYVLNEGSSGGSISLINLKTEEVTNKAYEAVNKLPLGTFPQALAISDKYLIITVTTSSEDQGFVEITDKTTLEHIASFPNLNYPREVVVNGNYAYVSNGKNYGEVIVINLNTLEIEGDPIKVKKGPEKMIVYRNKLYVANSGSYDNDQNSVSVIDLSTRKVVNEYTVKMCPKDMAIDAEGKLWVYCGGQPDYSNYPNVTYADNGLSIVNTNTDEISSIEFGAVKASGIKNIAASIDKQTIYVITDAVYALNYMDTQFPATPLIDKVFYGMDIHPVSGNLWVCHNLNYTNPSKIEEYSVDGELVKQYTVGVTPNSVAFHLE